MKYLLSLLMALPLWSCAKEPSPKLSSYRWKNRILVVEIPSAQEKLRTSWNLSVQKNQAELEERDLIILPADEVLRKELSLPKGEASLILIGKDGGVKARQVGSFDLKALFRKIDEMPMRKAEMEEASGGR